jgi:transcription initiation factor TFIIIB Brf1 subunit/transcription initiation factor TFIIB
MYNIYIRDMMNNELNEFIMHKSNNLLKSYNFNKCNISKKHVDPDIPLYDFHTTDNYESDHDCEYDDGISVIDKYSSDELTNDDCLNCKKRNTVKTYTSEGSRTCTSCGHIASEILDEGAEWHKYDDDSHDVMARCSGTANKYGVVTTTKSSRMNKLQNWLSMDHKQRSKNKIIGKIHDICTKANIRKCAIDDIKGIYTEFTEGTVGDNCSTVRGLNKTELAAAITFYVCKQRGIPRLPHEIAEMYSLNVSDITDGCRTFVELMRLKQKNYDLVTSTPEEYLIRLAPELKVNAAFINLAIKLARNVRIIGIAAEHTPPSIAAVSILLTAKLKNIDMESKEVSAIFRISHTTSDKTMEKLKKYIKIITNDQTALQVSKIIDKKKAQIVNEL